VLYDAEPNRLIIDSLRRDFSNFQNDSFLLVLDTFLDKRSGYGFGTNAAGAQRDVQVTDNGRRNDANWDGAWIVRSTVTDNGWSTEIAVPFKTLRFPAGDVQEWGLNLQRIIRRKNEYVIWAPVPRQFSHYAVSYAGVLTGINSIESGRDLRITPFTTGQFKTSSVGTRTWDPDGDGGVDLKWGLTSSLLLDASYRTDFSQVEADEQQINLTRFSLFFPEKRQFFLENPGNFQVGLSSVETQRRDLVPFFSRRIGLSASGQPIPVIGGLRLTGRPAGYGLGVLTMQTDDADGQPGTNYTRARGKGRDEHRLGRRVLLRPRDDRRSELQQGDGRRSAARPQAGAGDRSIRDAKRDGRRGARLGRAHQLQGGYERASGAPGPCPHR